MAATTSESVAVRVQSGLNAVSVITGGQGRCGDPLRTGNHSRWQLSAGATVLGAVGAYSVWRMGRSYGAEWLPGDAGFRHKHGCDQPPDAGIRAPRFRGLRELSAFRAGLLSGIGLWGKFCLGSGALDAAIPSVGRISGNQCNRSQVGHLANWNIQPCGDAGRAHFLVLQDDRRLAAVAVDGKYPAGAALEPCRDRACPRRWHE